MKENKESTPAPSFLDYLTIVFRRRKFVYKTILMGIMLSAVISVMMRNQYTASATILPPNTQQDLMYGFISQNMLSSYTGASGLTTLLAGGTRPSDLYAAILGSGHITGALINKYDLRKVFKVKTNYDAAKQLDEITRIGVSPEGMITVSVTWHDKFLATDIANSYIEELDKFNTETAMTVGKKYRIFIEQRLQENRDSLMLAEERLKEFQKKHKTVALDVEIQMAIETIAKLKSEIILREVQKGAMSTGGNIQNPYIQSLDKELRELKKQLSTIEFGSKNEQNKGFGAGFSVPFTDLPELSLEYARLLRETKIQEAIFELLTQQYEQAKIMEAKDTPTVQLLDHASPPEKKSKPKRMRIVILVAVLSTILSIAGVFILESFDKIKTNPDRYHRWLYFKEKLKNDIQKVRLFVSRRK